MLRPQEFHVGDLVSEPRDELTLVLPRSEYEHAGMIGSAFDEYYGVTLGGDLPCQAYPVTNDEPWEGIIIPNARIEVDERSCYDPAARVEVGSMIRDADRLSVVAITGARVRIGRTISVVVLSGLPPSASSERAGFRKWRILIGEGNDVRELFTVDATKVAQIREASLDPNRH